MHNVNVNSPEWLVSAVPSHCTYRIVAWSRSRGLDASCERARSLVLLLFVLGPSKSLCSKPLAQVLTSPLHSTLQFLQLARHSQQGRLYNLAELTRVPHTATSSRSMGFSRSPPHRPPLEPLDWVSSVDQTARLEEREGMSTGTYTALRSKSIVLPEKKTRA